MAEALARRAAGAELVVAEPVVRMCVPYIDERWCRPHGTRGDAVEYVHKCGVKMIRPTQKMSSCKGRFSFQVYD
ncbi:hypothetical protein Pogu_1543 [Pyrobaculum oguniense TE7]|uniref:Uncharacterized protein n=1 Tax=Pyrobaculum oguniense (strain DSM 13380 / JCM 10595 / TE7) TaxID=698757 RepID=H6QC98_PYROT|nr:hypothetical protein Pogu_1543 [Pyrobaculum oguniense TE7]